MLAPCAPTVKVVVTIGGIVEVGPGGEDAIAVV